MKTISVSFLLVGMLFPAVCSAQSLEPPPGPPPGPPPEGKSENGPPRPMLEAWKNADKDHDGFISKAEFDAMPRIQNLSEEKRIGIFLRLDKNADGKLSPAELGKFGRPRDGKPMKRLWELDTNKSGGIDFEEFKAGELFKKLSPERQERVFKRLDTDGDGIITPKDRPEPPFKHPERLAPEENTNGKGETCPAQEGGPKLPGPVNRKLDTNGDGALSLEEFRSGNAVKNLPESQQKDLFDLLDRNADLKISPEDFSESPEIEPDLAPQQ